MARRKYKDYTKERKIIDPLVDLGQVNFKVKEASIKPLLEVIENLSVTDDLEKILSIISKHSKLKTFCHFLRQDGGYINENSPYRNKRDYFKNMIIKLKGGKEWA